MKNSANSYWIIGKHAVEAAINNPQRIIQRLCITKETKLKNKIISLKPEILSRQQISKIIGGSSAHQGVAIQVKTLKNLSINEFLLKNKNKKNIVIVLDQITDTQNIGAILRSAQAFSVSAIICQTKHSPKENTLIAKAAAGALEFVPLIYVKNISQTLNILKKNNYWSLGLDGKANQSLNMITKDGKLFNNNLALVLGSEGRGIRELIIKNCDICCKIDINNTIDSLNVSVALGITLYEITRFQKI